MTDPQTADASLLVIDAPHFYCGVIVRNERVIRAAPIVRYLLGWNADRLKSYCRKRGWRVEAVPLNGGADKDAASINDQLNNQNVAVDDEPD